MKLEAAIELWREARQGAPNTILGYTRNFRMLRAAGFETLDDLTPQRFAAYRQHALASGLSPITVNCRLSAVVVVLRWLEPMGRAPEGLADRLARLRLSVPEPPPPRAWTREQFDLLVEAAERMGRRRKGVSVWLVRFLRLGVFSGLRPGELLRVEREDLDLGSEPTVLVSRARAETKSCRERRVPLCAEIADYLREVAPRRGPLFPARRGKTTKRRWLNTHWVQTIFRELEHESGIEATAHQCRRTFTTWSLAAGIPATVVARWLGHTTLEILYRHYAAVLPSFDPIVEKLGARR